MKIKYYEAPPQEVFDQIKKASLEIWGTYDDTYGYASEKINKVKKIQNIKDNAWHIAGMFDAINQRRLLTKLDGEAFEMLGRILGNIDIDFN